MAIENVGDFEEFNYTGGIQTFVPSVGGVYLFDVYGGQGGTGNTKTGGKGGHSTGYKKLNSGETLYICVGGKGANKTTYSATAKGGYNGGGNSTGTSDAVHFGGGGGGCTHIASVSGTLKTIGSSGKDNVYIVAGGGGGGFQNTAGKDYSGTGGTGGGTSGGNGTNSTAGGKPSSGYAFGYGQSEGGPGGGGGGLYGGKAVWGTSGGGGSGYIGGVPSFDHRGISYSSLTENGKRSGDGYAKITLVALDKIFNLFRDGEAVQNAFLNGEEISQICLDGVPVFGNP